MNLFKKIFPILLHLNILQLEEYKVGRFLSWNLNHILTREVEVKKKLVFTIKIKNIILIYALILLASTFITVVIPLILIIEPFIGLALATLLLKPIEIYKKRQTITRVNRKIKESKNLKVIGITGSFGKSSTKEILYQLLKSKYQVLRTPESFNTVFGITKVVDLELDNSYDYFICEMAAYKIGEIKELCKMVPPDYGILTGITTQHFERFGSLENTIKAKFELIDAINDKQNIIFNLNDENILSEVRRRGIKINNPTLSTSNIKFTKNGSTFNLIYKGKTYKAKTVLFGLANIKNILLASEMALKLGLNISDLIRKIEALTPSDNRMFLFTEKNTTIINNTYSSNIQSFKEIIETAKLISGKKVLVTPGIVELGNLEIVAHENLGKLAKGVFDKVILVGQNQKTQSLANGLEKNYEFINDTRTEYFKKLDDLKNKFNWIFLENDLTQNY